MDCSLFDVSYGGPNEHHFFSTKKQNLKPDKLPKPAQLGKLQILKLVKLRSQTQEDEDDAIAPRGLGAFDGYGSRDDDDDADSGGDDWSAPAASPDARERGFDRDDYSAEDDLCKGVRRMSTTPQKVPERAPFRHYSYRDADERPPAWQRKSAF